MKNILVVDGSKRFQTALKERIEGGGRFTPYTSGSYVEAKGLIEKGMRFYAAIIDLELEDSVDGAMVEFAISQKIPTIVFARQMDRELRNKIVRLPIVDYIVKHDLGEVASAVEMAENLLFLKGRKVLIADESRLGRMELRMYLDTLLFEVHEAKNMVETLTQIETLQNLSLVIIPDSLRGEAGFELVRTLRRQHGSDDVFIYGITSDSREDVKLEFLKSGANDCITRPIIKEEFNARIINSMKILEQGAQIAKAQKNILDSIRFASMIQNSVLPEESVIARNLHDYFLIWEPRDLVGGDIYLFEECANGFLLFVIDCTGHGVPGAFMTMVVKTALGQVLGDMDCMAPDPAAILQSLNRIIKSTLGQDREKTASDNGLDGGVMYYDSEKKQIIYAGARTPLYYVRDGKIESFASDRVSIGYKRSDVGFVFSNFTLDVQEGIRIYLSTDGMIEQPGGSKGHRFGKKRFVELLKESQKLSFAAQKKKIIETLKIYQSKEERMDDVTLFGCEIKPDGAEQSIRRFQGEVTQEVLVGFIEALEKPESEISQKVLMPLQTLLMELAQNIMKYGSQNAGDSLLEVGYDKNRDKHYVLIENWLETGKVAPLQERLDEVASLDKAGIKKLYKERRRSGENQHSRGAGLGLLEIARHASEPLYYAFENMSETYTKTIMKAYI